MAQLLATYTRDAQRHHVELVRLRDGPLLLDRAGAGEAALVVAELAIDEGEAQARAVLGPGGYLRRARAGESGLCRALGEDERRGRVPRARAA